VVTANSLSLPLCTSGSAAVTWSNMNGTCPAATSVRAAGVPLYGTWVSFTPTRSANISPARWGEVPVPEEAKVRRKTLIGLRSSRAGM